jgi:hypothetical protein
MSENDAYMNLYSNSTYSKYKLYPNVVRTKLLVLVNDENNRFLRWNRIRFNSEDPRDIMKKYENFIQFENPVIVSSSNRRHDKMRHTSSSNIRFKIFDSNVPQIPNLKVEKPKPKNETQYHAEHLVNLIENKKILFSRKKLLHNSIMNINYEETKVSEVSFKRNSKRKKTIQTLPTSLARDSKLKFLLNEEELKKEGIQYGFDKLQIINQKLKHPSNKNDNKSSPFDQSKSNSASTKKYSSNLKYEELFELLEFKGIDFNSKNIKSKNSTTTFYNLQNPVSERNTTNCRTLSNPKLLDHEEMQKKIAKIKKDNNINNSNNMSSQKPPIPRRNLNEIFMKQHNEVVKEESLSPQKINANSPATMISTSNSSQPHSGNNKPFTSNPRVERRSKSNVSEFNLDLYSNYSSIKRKFVEEVKEEELLECSLNSSPGHQGMNMSKSITTHSNVTNNDSIQISRSRSNSNNSNCFENNKEISSFTSEYGSSNLENYKSNHSYKILETIRSSDCYNEFESAMEKLSKSSKFFTKSDHFKSNNKENWSTLYNYNFSSNSKFTEGSEYTSLKDKTQSYITKSSISNDLEN